MTLCECRYHWPEQPRRSREEANQAMRQAFVAGEELDANRQTAVRGWYQYPGAQAGFLLLELDSAEALHAFLAPYMELMSWEVRPLLMHDYTQFRQQVLGDKA